MRLCMILCVMACLSLMGGVTICRADPAKKSGKESAERIARLIRQLGHKDFAKRQLASKELDAIGAPALDALRKATADRDPEIRRRAERIVHDIDERLKEREGPQVHLESAVFITDLPLAESKTAVHRISLDCRLADGGKGVLNLDPNLAKLDEFGDAIPGGAEP